MGQAASCCASRCCCCCRCSFWRRLSHTTSRESHEHHEFRLLKPSLEAPRKAREREAGKYSLIKKPPHPHLRGLSDDINQLNQVVRVVLIGACDTGKTCFLRRYLEGYYAEHGHHDDYRRTLGADFGRKLLEVADHQVRLQMWDTGGSEAYRSVISHYLHAADGVILCYDVNRKASLEDLKTTWVPFVDKHAPGTCRVLLSGNKADHPYSEDGDRRLIRQAAERVAEAIDAQLFETSARLGHNIDVVGFHLIQEIIHHRKYSARETVPGGGTVVRSGRKQLSLALRDVMMDARDRYSSPPSSCEKKSDSLSKTSSSDGTATRGRISNRSSSDSCERDDKDDEDDSDLRWIWPSDISQFTSDAKNYRHHCDDSGRGGNSGEDGGGGGGGDYSSCKYVLGEDGIEIELSLKNGASVSQSVDSQGTVPATSVLSSFPRTVDPEMSSSNGGCSTLRNHKYGCVTSEEHCLDELAAGVSRGEVNPINKALSTTVHGCHAEHHSGMRKSGRSALLKPIKVHSTVRKSSQKPALSLGATVPPLKSPGVMSRETIKLAHLIKSPPTPQSSYDCVTTADESETSSLSEVCSRTRGKLSAAFEHGPRCEQTNGC